MTTLRFGLIGTGHWALQAHGPGLVASPHSELVGVWGRSPARAAEVAGQLGARAYEDLDRMLAEVDAVALAVPPDVQAELAVRAARAGRHLLMDKPMSFTAEGARQVVEAVDEAGVASVVFFTARFRTDVEAWTNEVAAKGPWHSGHLEFYANIYQAGNPYGASNWRRERGALWDVGPHALAALLPVLGPVSALSARRGPTGSDTVHLLLDHGPSRGSEAAGPPADVVSTSVVSLSLTMPAAATGNQFVLRGDRGTVTRPETAFEAVDAYLNAVAQLVGTAGAGSRSHPCDAHFGLQVVEVLAAAEVALGKPGTQVRH